MKNADAFFTLLGTIVLVALATTLVLPGRQTPAVIKAGGNAFSGSLKAALGK